MTNFEWLLENKKELVKRLISSNDSLAVAEDGTIDTCISVDCEQCKFQGFVRGCSECSFEWLNKDFSKQKLTKREYTFLSIFPNNWKWIVRYKSGLLCCFENKPYKNKNTASWDAKYGASSCFLEDIFGDIFEFITWNDSEPWAVNELLQLEVKDE